VSTPKIYSKGVLTLYSTLKILCENVVALSYATINGSSSGSCLAEGNNFKGVLLGRGVSKRATEKNIYSRFVMFCNSVLLGTYIFCISSS